MIIRLVLSFLLVVPFLLNSICVYGEGNLTVTEYEQLLQKALKSKDHEKAAHYCYEMGKLLWEEKKEEKAVDYLNQSLSYNKKSGDNMISYLASHQLGQIFSETNSHSKALDHFQKALKLAKELNKSDFVNDELINVAVSYAQLSKHKKSIAPLEEALSLALVQNNIQLQQKCYQLLSVYYQIVGNSNKASEHKTLLNNLIKSKQNEEQSVEQLKLLEQQIQHVSVEKNAVSTKLQQQSRQLRKAEDSLLNTKNSLEVTANNLQETTHSLKEFIEISEHRQLQIDVLNKDKELAEMRIQEQNARLEYEAWIRNLVIGGIFMSSAFVVVVVIGYRRKIEANKKIEHQNKNIKSSINYAKRIQEAMLPNEEQQNTLLPNSFVLLKPRDSVSGDFYWMKEIKRGKNQDIIFSAADCTGHGVPGAFMSMVGINSLNGIVNRGISETNEILDALDVEIRSSLHQDISKNNDGMDIALCIYRSDKKILEYSGAKNPLIYIKNNELVQIKGSIQSIGGNNTKYITPFKKHIIEIDAPTMIYMFSDGYKDQFGDNNKGKFMSKKFTKLLFDTHQLSLDNQKEILDKTIEEWKGNEGQTDDILVMGVKLQP